MSQQQDRSPSEQNSQKRLQLIDDLPDREYTNMADVEYEVGRLKYNS